MCRKCGEIGERIEGLLRLLPIARQTIAEQQINERVRELQLRQRSLHAASGQPRVSAAA